MIALMFVYFLMLEYISHMGHMENNKFTFHMGDENVTYRQNERSRRVVYVWRNNFKRKPMKDIPSAVLVYNNLFET